MNDYGGIISDLCRQMNANIPAIISITPDCRLSLSSCVNQGDMFAMHASWGVKPPDCRLLNPRRWMETHLHLLQLYSWLPQLRFNRIHTTLSKCSGKFLNPKLSWHGSRAGFTRARFGILISSLTKAREFSGAHVWGRNICAGTRVSSIDKERKGTLFLYNSPICPCLSYKRKSKPPIHHSCPMHT